MKLKTIQAQAELDRETKLSQLRTTMENETAVALGKTMEGLKAESVEYLRLHRLTIENELRNDHSSRLNKLKEEAKEALKAEEKRIRTSMMANHKEQENQLQLDLIQHHQLSLNDLQNEIEVRNVHQLKKIRRTAAKHLQQAEQELATELQNEMQKELDSLDAHQRSERDDVSNELNLQFQEKLNHFKLASVDQCKKDMDAMNDRFDEDCNNAKQLMGNLFGSIVPASKNNMAQNETNNVAYIVRIQQEYSDMHNAQVKTATTLAEMAREASRLRRDLRESKRAQLLAARARADLPSLISQATRNKRNMVHEDTHDITSKMLIDTNRRLVDKLNRMSQRYTDLEDDISMNGGGSMRMSSLNGGAGGGAGGRAGSPSRRSQKGSPLQANLHRNAAVLELSSDSDQDTCQDTN